MRFWIEQLFIRNLYIYDTKKYIKIVKTQNENNNDNNMPFDFIRVIYYIYDFGKEKYDR